MIFRPATLTDLPAILDIQEPAAIAALSHIFPQDKHPFDRGVILQRWTKELADPNIYAYVVTDESGAITGFAATRNEELLHFGTALEHWGTGLATELHEYVISELRQRIATETDHLYLRVFEENGRARRFYEKLGWECTNERSRTTFEPHPVLVGYRLRLLGIDSFPALTDDIITLRCLTLADTEAHVAGEDDDQRRLLSGGRSTVDGVRAWITKNQNEWRSSGPRRNFGIYNADGTLVGNAEANLASDELKPGEVNISYAVFPAYQGNQFAARAIELLCNWLTNFPSATHAIIQVDEDNHHSLAIPKACQFAESGTVTNSEGVTRRRFQRELRKP